MKLKLFVLALAIAVSFALAACDGEQSPVSSEAAPVSSTVETTPESMLSKKEMLDICELATLDCYYHNVVKILPPEEKSILPWVKYKHYWIEYSGIVTLGIDASKVEISVDGTQVEITIPKAKILDYQVEKSSLTDNDEYIVLAKDSAKIDADDETTAFTKAEENMKATAQADTTQFDRALQRAESLLANYVSNIGEATGKSYNVSFRVIESEDSPASSTTSSEASSAS